MEIMGVDRPDGTNMNLVTDMQLHTLPKTNISPENRPLEKEIPIGNHHFWAMLVLGSVPFGNPSPEPTTTPFEALNLDFGQKFCSEAKIFEEY